MVTYNELKNTAYGGGKQLVEISCLSTDTKPTEGVMNGSTCIEMDTGKIYFFDEAGATWREFA